MKITKLTTFIVPPRWCFLKIETDEGIVGWGESVVEGRAHTVAAAVDELSDYLIGKDPRNVQDLWDVMYRSGFYRGGPVMMSAIAGVDQALWDIKGKALKGPVYDLLGGPVRDKIRVYSWIGGDRPADTAEQAKAAVARGFTAVKMNGTQEMQYIDTHAKVQQAVENVAVIREAVGNDIGIGVDFHGRVHKPMAKVLMRELRDFNLMESTNWVICFLALAFFGNGLASITWSLVSALAPTRLLGLTGGVFNLIGNMSAIVTSLIIGFLVQDGSFAPALAYVSGLALLGALSYILLVGEVKRISED